MEMSQFRASANRPVSSTLPQEVLGIPRYLKWYKAICTIKYVMVAFFPRLITYLIQSAYQKKYYQNYILHSVSLFGVLLREETLLNNTKYSIMNTV